jgi:prolyl-tRNA editing enzyme YbaK/EbsC (Cys-tRNA(Pro) deacylase)
LPVAAVAKRLVLTAPAAYVRVVLPASERRGLDKARAYVGGGKRVHLAREEKLARDYPAFEFGSGAAAGHIRRERVLCRVANCRSDDPGRRAAGVKLASSSPSFAPRECG